jgi:hypothetical protein
VAGRGAGLLGLAAELLIHAQAFRKKDAPFVGLIFDRFDFKTGAVMSLSGQGRTSSICISMSLWFWFSSNYLANAWRGAGSYFLVTTFDWHWDRA